MFCRAPNASTYNTFFFVMTTISTIGYYSEIDSILGKVLIIVLIIVAIVVIPNRTSELMMLLASKSIYSRLSYKKTDEVKYIIITGNITYNSMCDLLQEYFHSDHGENERHALILLPQTPDVGMKYLLQQYQNKLFYFEGDPLKEADLKRCQFTDASTIIILCNKQTDDSTAEDSKTILQAMAIKKQFTLEGKYNNLALKETKMLIQLLRPESELHFSLSISRDRNVDQILCIDELKLSLLAKSCLCQGIIALISNLIMTSNIDINDTFVESNKWLEEYTKGKGYEIYKVPLDSFRGERYENLVYDIFDEKGVILFGINLEDKVELHTLVLLSPSGFVIPLQNDVNVYGYLLAEDKSMADEVISWGQSRKMKTLNTRRLNDSMIKPNEKKLKTSITELNNLNIEEDTHSGDERDINDIYASSDVISISYLCHITTEAIDKSTVICESIENKLVALEHIIICGICQNFIDFIKPLRAKHLPKSKCPTIVILSKEIPDDKLWSTIAFFEQIYIVQGDPMKKEDLQRAGIKNAIKVVILSPTLEEIFKNKYNTDDNKKQARKLTKEEEDLLDSKTIFKYNMISKLKKDIFIVVELINPKNVSFLYNKGRKQNDEYLFIKNGMKIDGTASFAAGEVYFSSIMDNLLVQAYYNKSLLAVLKKLILGEDQSVYKKPPLNRYRQIVSSNLYLIDNPFDSEDKIRDFLNTEILENKDPDERDFIPGRKLRFDEIFSYLLQKGILLIGIYRSIDSVISSKTNHNSYFFERKNSNFYFVYTSPDKKDSLDFKDKLFVLSQSFPENLLEPRKPILKYQSTLEGNPFRNYIASNLKKTEEKKDPKFETIDKTGTNKIKEINSLLKEVNTEIDELKDNLIGINDDIYINLANEIRKKISGLFGLKSKSIKANKILGDENLNDDDNKSISFITDSANEEKKSINSNSNSIDRDTINLGVNRIIIEDDKNNKRNNNNNDTYKISDNNARSSLKSSLKRQATQAQKSSPIKTNSLIFKTSPVVKSKSITVENQKSKEGLNEDKEQVKEKENSFHKNSVNIVLQKFSNKELDFSNDKVVDKDEDKKYPVLNFQSSFEEEEKELNISMSHKSYISNNSKSQKSSGNESNDSVNPQVKMNYKISKKNININNLDQPNNSLIGLDKQDKQDKPNLLTPAELGKKKVSFMK